MKQTAHGGSSTRLAGMQAATYGEQPEADQFAGVLEEEEEENWPDFDAPHKGEEVGEASKSAGKEGDQPTTQVEEPPAQVKGGATQPS